MKICKHSINGPLSILIHPLLVFCPICFIILMLSLTLRMCVYTNMYILVRVCVEGGGAFLFNLLTWVSREHGLSLPWPQSS